MCGLSEDKVFNALSIGYTEGYITKDEYALKLRENQVACNKMKSEDRERAKVLLRVLCKDFVPKWMNVH